MRRRTSGYELQLAGTCAQQPTPTAQLALLFEFHTAESRRRSGTEMPPTPPTAEFICAPRFSCKRALRRRPAGASFGFLSREVTASLNDARDYRRQSATPEA